MEFVNLTRGAEIGANSYLLRLGGKKILLDAGMHPKQAGMLAMPDHRFIGEDPLDAILLTHAHQDHIGALPFMTRMHPATPVFMTEATYRIGDVMLHNSVNVMTKQLQETQAQDYPLFTHRGVEFSRKSWRRMRVNRPFDSNGDPAPEEISATEPTFEFFEAGHILGSSGVLIRHEGRTLFYTGDVHFDDQTLMQKAAFPESGVDVLVMETTRGDAPTAPGFTRAAEELRLAEAIKEAFARDAAVTIPVFALGKSQELMAMLWQLKLRGVMPNCPMYIGGLSTKITEVYDELASTSRRNLPDLSLLNDVAPYVVSGRDIDSLNPRKRCIFALSSGMVTENTLSNIFVRRIIEDENQALFFVGYSDPESPGGKIRAAARGDMVTLNEKLPPVRLLCDVKEFNFSAHATRESLRDYAVRLKPKTILLVHGDEPALAWFQSELSRLLPDTGVLLPPLGKTVEL